MTGLRIELRRSTALWAGLLVLVSSTGMLLLLRSPNARWQGNSTSAVFELRLALLAVWALVVGLAVLQGMRDSRAGVTELFSSTSRPGWVRLGTPASAVAGAVAVATALLCVGMVAVVAFGGGFVSIGFVPLMVTVVIALAASVLVGIAVGRLLPHPLTVPVALVATFVVGTTADRGLQVSSADEEVSRLALLTPIFQPPSTDLVTTSTSVDIGQIVWFTGLGVTAFLLLVSRSPGGRLAALVPAGLAVALALTILPSRISDILVTDSIAGELVCDGPVCLSRAHNNSLPAVAAVGREVLAKLAVLPGPPTEVREDTSALAHLTVPPRNENTIYLRSQGSPSTLKLPPDQLRLEMFAGAGVASCSTPNTASSAEAVVRYLTAGYFNGGLARLASDPHRWDNGHQREELETAWQALRGQPAREQLDRVATARRMLLACEDSERTLDVLTAP